MRGRVGILCVTALLGVVVMAIVSAGRAQGAPPDPIGPGHVVRISSHPGGGSLLRYRSTGIGGQAVEETAVVWLPDGPRSGAVVAWAHQTVGLADQCAPSKQPSLEVPGLNRLLAAGDVVVAPDYEGLGTPGVHPYLVGVSEGRSLLDAIRAARQVAGVDGRSAAFGWSQGGHAALFAAKLAPTYAPDVRFAGAAALAPVTSVSALVDGDSPLSHFPGVVSMIAAGYTTAYPSLDAADVLAEPDQQLATAEDVCDPATELAGTATKPAAEPWAQRLRENDPSSTPITVPVLLAQGEDDNLLPISDTVGAADELCAQGSPVDLMTYPATDHATIPTVSLPDVMRWLRDRLAGHTVRGCRQERAQIG